MLDVCRLIVSIVIDLLRPRAALEAEILVLRQQIIVLRRGRPGRMPFLAVDRMVLGCVCQLFPKSREALAIVRPDTVVRWHRAGFCRYWRWKSRAQRGRPGVPAEIRQLIREMSVDNPLWGAPRIHGELIKLGFDIGQTSVAKYMARGRRPPSQG
jgi:transposase InsO family protein